VREVCEKGPEESEGPPSGIRELLQVTLLDLKEGLPVADTTDFIAYFSIIPDPRVERTKKHRLIDILFIAVCTMICGGEDFTDMELFGQAKEEWLRTLLELPHGIPSHDTFGRVFSLLDPQAFGECFLRWGAALHEATKGEVIALAYSDANR
jgi:hypothetical protein